MTNAGGKGPLPTGLEFCLLGPLIVRRDDAVVPVQRGKQRAVLAALLMNANRVVRLDQLAEVLWGPASPPSARVTLQNYVTRLRKGLGDAGRTRISTQPGGYQISVADGELDVIRFEALLGSAHAAGRDGSWERVGRQARAALALWRGEPLADVESEFLAMREIPRLIELWLRAVEARIDADLHLGRAGAVVGELRQFAAVHPLRERLHGLLMLALYADGRPAEALAAYQDARGVLVGELGTEPGPALRELHQRMLRADPALGADEGHWPGASLVRLVGSGGGLAGRHDLGRPAGAGGGLATFAGAVCQLPPDVADFTGRRDEGRRLAALLTGEPDGTAVPVAVISGPPGAGKTALALHAGHALRAAFPDGQLFVPLAGASACPREPTEMLGELLRALGPDGNIPDTERERAALLRSRLAGRRALMVIDDAGSATQVRPLLPGAAGCAVIVTSRHRLAGLDGAQLIVLGTFSPSEAATLLSRAAGSRRVAAEPEAAARLTAACGQLPLAVRIAGAKLAARPSWPVARLARLIADERRRLDELAIDDLAVRASVRPSYEALDERARRAFRRLSLLGARDFAEWTVAALLGEPDASDVVSVLADRSLLTLAGTDATGEPRYQLHDLLRDYAAEQLAAEPATQTQAALRRVVGGYLELASLAQSAVPREPTLPPPLARSAAVIVPADGAARLTASPVAWFTAERLSLLAATRQAVAAGWPELAVPLADYQLTFQDSQGRIDDAETLWQAIEATAGSADDPALVARAQFMLAVILAWRGQFADAMPMLARCAGPVGMDPQAVAYLKFCQGYCAMSLERLAEACDLAREGLDRARVAGDLSAQSQCLRLLGLALMKLGDISQGLRYCRDGVATARQAGNPVCECQAQQSLASALFLTGDYPAAQDQAQQALDQATRVGYLWGQARCLTLLGDSYQALGRPYDAIAALSLAQPINERYQSRSGQALCHLKLGRAHQALGHHRQAISHLEQSLPIFRELRFPPGEELAERALAEAHAAIPPG
jgi:DNA-binding SARP family transcriptional activator/tetratricopeptide (TPR) repeat protein